MQYSNILTMEPLQGIENDIAQRITSLVPLRTLARALKR